jgi:hypothetical protein
MKLDVEIGETIDVVGNGARVSLPFPSQGYGGHELVVSPSARYLGLNLYFG